jgi:hypothetical protein
MERLFTGNTESREKEDGTMEDGPGDLDSIKGELPIGLGMRLMQDRTAMDRYTALPDAEKKRILSYVEGGATGDDAEERVAGTVKSLHDGTPVMNMGQQPPVFQSKPSKV